VCRDGVGSAPSLPRPASLPFWCVADPFVRRASQCARGLRAVRRAPPPVAWQGRACRERTALGAVVRSMRLLDGHKDVRPAQAG